MLIKGKLDEIGVMNILLGKSSDTLHMSFKFTSLPKNLMSMYGKFSRYLCIRNKSVIMRRVYSIWCKLCKFCLQCV